MNYPRKFEWLLVMLVRAVVYQRTATDILFAVSGSPSSQLGPSCPSRLGLRLASLCIMSLRRLFWLSLFGLRHARKDCVDVAARIWYCSTCLFVDWCVRQSPLSPHLYAFLPVVGLSGLCSFRAITPKRLSHSSRCAWIALFWTLISSWSYLVRVFSQCLRTLRTLWHCWFCIKARQNWFRQPEKCKDDRMWNHVFN